MGSMGHKLIYNKPINRSNINCENNCGNIYKTFQLEFAKHEIFVSLRCSYNRCCRREYTRDGGSDFFIDDLDSIQGALEDIESAGKDLEVLEAQLQTLVENKALIFAAEEAIEDGVNAENIKNDFKHD